MTIGDMFPELMSASRGTGKKEKRRRPVEEDDDDLSNLDFDVEETTEEPATTETAEQE
jgi:hypothetical protein